MNPVYASIRFRPGAIATGIIGKALGLTTEAAEKTSDMMREVYKTAQPIQRAGLTDDIAYAALYLASAGLTAEGVAELCRSTALKSLSGATRNLLVTLASV